MEKGIAKAVAYYNPVNQSYVDKMAKSEYNKSLSQYIYIYINNLILVLLSKLGLICAVV